MIHALNHQPLEAIARLFVNNWLINGMGGGLIVGRTHQEGHILMVSPTEKLGELTVIGVVSGGEYLMGREATRFHRDRLNEINGDKSPCTAQIQVPVETRILNTRGEPHDKFLLVHEQFIVNAEATKRHFAELDAMNAQFSNSTGVVLLPEELEALKASST